MSRYYLRVEAVNLAHFVYDTEKIQPLRGGSYLLLDAVHGLDGRDFGGVTLKKITTGASIGVLSFDIDEIGARSADDIIESVVSGVRCHLAERTGGHATFVVDAVNATDDFVRDIETLAAMNRWRQFQQPTLVLPAGEAQTQCDFDGVRPGTKSVAAAGESKTVSDSVSFRMKAGRELRSTIYKRILKRELSVEFTDDLADLSSDDSKGNLNNKIAVIYLDGNSFTKIRSTVCTTSDALGKFSETVEGLRRVFLDNLVNKAAKERDFKTSSDKVRLEILLWGGDEIEIVVPAWKGWAVLRLFYDCMKNARFDSYELTHAGGIVFSNHKAPILQLRKLARELADFAKESLSGNVGAFTHGSHDVTHYLVLESFDILGADMRDFVKRYYDAQYPGLILTPVVMDNVEKALKLMKTKGFPRNKVFEVVSLVKTAGNDAERQGVVSDVFDRALSEVDDAADIRCAINDVVGDNLYCWLLIADLWDYVGGES
ncbi:MAG: hypothetical protein GXP46_12325 [Deferribacteres bacterium]|nr:hypothetical protein [Deferribacteres bacterium]